MTDLPPIDLQFGVDGAPVAIVQQVEIKDAAQLLQVAPALGDPRWVFAYAQAVNHIAQGDSHELITDPAAFEAKYRAAYAAEDPDEDVGPGTIRLHNFGIPDFASIHPPKMDGDTLVFFAENMFLGIPYRVTMAQGGEPDYQPVAMVE